jgi:hypothetical protein
MSRYEVARYHPALRDEVVRLQTHHWGTDAASNSAYLTWKYERNPYYPEPIVHVVRCAGRVVGMRGLYGARWEAGSPVTSFLGLCAGDLVIEPEHRNHGAVTQLMEAVTRDLPGLGSEYVFNLSASPTTQMASLRAGWKSVGPFAAARRHSSQERLARRLSRLRILWRLATLLSSGERLAFLGLDRRTGSARGPVAVSHEPRAEAMARVVDRLGGDGRIRHVRDEAFFRWRYHNPLSSYRFVYWGARELDGYLVLRASALPAGRRASIVDWEGVDERVRAGLLDAAIRWGGFAELAIWPAAAPAGSEAILRRRGFARLPVPDSIGTAVRARLPRNVVLVRAAEPGQLNAADWRAGGRSLLEPANWDLRMIYSDTF